VADNAETSHDIQTGALRAFEDSTNWGANVQGVIQERAFEKRDASKPGGFWRLKAGAKVNEAWQQVKIDMSILNPLLELLRLGRTFGDEDTNIPKITQGMQEDRRAGVTAFEISLQSEKADQYSGGVLRQFDENLLEQILTAVFKRNMRDPSITTGRGDFVVQALGYAAFQDRITRVKALTQMLMMALNSETLSRKAKWDGMLKPWTEAQRVEYESAWYTDEEVAQMEAEEQERQRQMEEQAAATEQAAAEAAIDKDRAAAESSRSMSTAKLAEVELKAEKDAEEAAQPIVEPTGAQAQKT
jgi:hypothetical protein